MILHTICVALGAATPLLYFRLCKAKDQVERSRKALHESSLRHNALFQSPLDGIITVRNLAWIDACNDAALRMLGFTEHPPEGALLTEIFPTLTTSALEQREVEFLRSAKAHSLLARHRDGWFFPVELALSSFPFEDSVYTTLFVRDITDRRGREEQLERFVREKEMLVREVHHRVKNNLQVISSLLSLQARKITSPESRALIQDSQNRVKAIALLHELVYQTGDFSQVNAQAYLERLCQTLLSSYRHQLNPSMIVRGQAVSLDLDAAIGVGIIVNEVVSTALLHAEHDADHAPRIEVRLKESESFVSLEVRDNGVRLGDKDTVRRPFGLRLIESLAKQMNGTVTLSDQGHNTIELKFPNSLRLNSFQSTVANDGSGSNPCS